MTQNSLLAQLRVLMPQTAAAYPSKLLKRAKRAAYTANRTKTGVSSVYGTGYEFDAEQKGFIRHLRTPAGAKLNAALTAK